ncbi:MAG: PhzF family phenazine biosynthesis protein [Bacteroidales bacterium]|jgi:PhzF family phenazine biosynthesis protein
MKSQQIIYQVDAFTTKPFKGNPAGVCIIDQEPDATWMQNIAMEMNLSETAFVFPGNNCLMIRFFTPEAEMKLCGHATLSASHVLYETGMVKSNEEIRFSSKAGELIIMKSGHWITMNFPVYPLEKMEITPEFEKVTGSIPEELHKTGFGWTLALMKSEKDVRSMKPHFSMMKGSVFGDLIVTSESEDPAFDFCVRCFAPAVGIDEDPVTGSAHCALAPFWSEKTGRKDFNSHQVSKREGILKVSMKGDRVEISGQAKTIFKAELYV